MSLSPASNSDDYDTLFKVGGGEGGKSKTFKLHSEILKKNSQYFTSAFSSEWVKKDEENDGLIVFEKPNITVEDFESIVKFLYKEPINFDEMEITNVFELLVPADELFLSNFIKEIETYLIKHHQRWLKKSFGIHYLSMTARLKICEELQTFAAILIAQSPQILFDSNSKKHLQIEDDALFVGLLNNEDFLMDEIEIWEFMIDWAKSSNDLSKKDIKDWSTEDFQRVGKSMENILPLIRFNNILANEFYEKVKPYRSIFTNNIFYENILWNYILPRKKPSSISTSPTLRKGAIDSKILKLKHAALISSWLDQRHVIYYNSQIPYKFILKCRGSDDGFSAEIFRLKTSTIPNTLLIIKVKETNEILGGYNSTHWGHDRSIKDKSFWRPAGNSFIFSVDTDPNKCDSASTRLSRINPDFSEKAFLISNYSGPQFGNGDLKLGNHFNFKSSSCKKSYYLESIRNTEDLFSIEEYELFQLVKET